MNDRIYSMPKIFESVVALIFSLITFSNVRNSNNPIFLLFENVRVIESGSVFEDLKFLQRPNTTVRFSN